ncbi:MAG: EAL domain-containing protein [Methyloprofundus sp.]|nr:EAL domain-containing protein [Methyloprofundus sp.]
MHKSKRFLSLKWKFALGFGVILISLYGLFSYFSYREAMQNFERSRTVAQENQINIAQALTEESFFVLERFVESVVMMHERSQLKHSTVKHFLTLMSSEKEITEQKMLLIVQLFDEHWLHWQMIWGLENAVLYNQQGIAIKRWGPEILENSELVPRVLSQEQPEYQVVCLQECFQQLVTPILSDSEMVGALSISLSLSDTLLNYQNAMHSDLGVINTEDEREFSAVTHSLRNNALWKEVRSAYELKPLIQQALNFKKDNEHYEIRAFSVSEQQQAPYYVIINNVTEEYKRLQKKFSSLAIIGLVGLLSAIFVLIINIHFTLARVTELSRALPLLVQYRYQLFRKKINSPRKLFFIDELEQLSHTAIQVVTQLEDLQDEAQKNTNLLLKQTSELQKERDFSTQLIDTAPIIIITQNAQGEVLSINQEGLSELHLLADEVIGKKFSALIPEHELEHREKLERLRTQNKQREVSFSGRLAVKSDDTIYIDWIHTTFRKTNSDQEAVILSLGVDVTEKHKADEKLVKMATQDQLTGLNNRRHFQKELDGMLAIAQRYGEKIALFYLDLDQFKVINDTHGHQAGDELLQSITSILKNATRETDLLSRIGGDEFALVIPAASLEGVEQLANKLLHALKVFDYRVNEQSYPISCSIGVAIYPEHGKSQQELLANADLAMYHAKKSGRSRYHIYSPTFEYQAVLTEQLRWKHIIEQAIEENEFILFYQPILDIKAKKISHYECLLRLEQGDGNILMPGDFISHAEETGIIDQLDRLVLKMAINQHLAFQKLGCDIRLAINLSGYSMNNMQILPYIEELLTQPGVSPELIIFEITETSAVSNFLSAKLLITKLNELGCHFALDDFGVGFSSFYYLRSLPVDYVKIDGAFVKQMDVNEEDRIFVKVLTELSQAFGKKIIAEFVENKEILNLLEQLGVDYAQGYYISKPLRDPFDLDHVQGLEEF